MNASNSNDPRTQTIIGAAFEVHKELGSGFLEAVYQEALTVEFEARGIPYQRERILPISYKSHVLSCPYRSDFVCYGEILVELKAKAAIGNVEQAQVINYLKASGFRLGLILNFGAARLEIKRVVFDSPNYVSGFAIDTPPSP